MLEILGYLKDGEVVDTAGLKGREKEITAQSHGGILASADFHGAEVQVVRCKDAGKVGIKGVVVRDTKFTFMVVTDQDEVKTLPKRDTVFRYEVPLPCGKPEEGVEQGGEEGEGRNLVFEVHGNQFELKPAERANRKFKWQVMDYL